MKRCSLLSLLVLSGAICPVHAQRPAESASPALIADVLKSLNCRFTLDDYQYSIEMKKRQFKLYRLDSGGRILLKASIAEQPSLQTINLYNAKLAVTTRAVQYEKYGLVLEAGIDCDSGITEARLRKFVLRFVDDIADFEKFLAANQGKADPEEPKVVKKGQKLPVPFKVGPDSDDKELMITFPTNDAKWETAWKIVWDMETGKQANDAGFRTPGKDKGGKSQPGFGAGRNDAVILFKIKKAFFKPGQKAEWIQVLEDAHPQEFYVPYYFQDTRFFDLKSVGGYAKLSAKEGGAISQTLEQIEAGDGRAARHRPRLQARQHHAPRRRTDAVGQLRRLQLHLHDRVRLPRRRHHRLPPRPDRLQLLPPIRRLAHARQLLAHRRQARPGRQQRCQPGLCPSACRPSPKEQGDKGKLSVEEITKESFLDWDPQEFTRIRVTNPNYSLVPGSQGSPRHAHQLRSRHRAARNRPAQTLHG